MPIYPLKNTETEEIFERVMKIAEYEQYLIENPHIQRYYDRGTPYLDPVRLGIVKPPSDFMKNVIGRMQENVAGNRLKETTKFSIPREW